MVEVVQVVVVVALVLVVLAGGGRRLRADDGATGRGLQAWAR